jgi:hypothetical protein
VEGPVEPILADQGPANAENFSIVLVKIINLVANKRKSKQAKQRCTHTTSTILPRALRNKDRQNLEEVSHRQSSSRENTINGKVATRLYVHGRQNKRTFPRDLRQCR